ncbi:hypothetical protein CMI47_06125, partial [Candidatus Pacearchaeota archaeon]|nr:hypothetical protein [Candidatus Pacearchaeota archaeon]
MSFKSFEEKDKIENVLSSVAQAMWSDSTATLTTFFTGSVQNSNSGKYYYDIHAEDDQTTDVQFAVTYGHYAGSGSEVGITAGKTNPTKAIYSQLKQLILPQESTKFNFHGESGVNYYSNDVFAIVCNRARYREKMDPGNWELHLKRIGSGSGDVSQSVVKLIDDSDSRTDFRKGQARREFNIVSGSIVNGIHQTASQSMALTSFGSYGTFYPEMGILLLNPNRICSGSGKPTGSVVGPLGTSGTSNDLNHRKLFTSIKSGSYFASRREEVKRSSYYFCRIPFNEFNHSQNPSYFTGTNAEIFNRSFITEPRSYITSVGLY